MMMHELRGKRFVIIDEYGVMGLQHWADICATAKDISGKLYGMHLPKDKALGHFHAILVGDVRQHVAPHAQQMVVPQGIKTLPAELVKIAGLSRAKDAALELQGAMALAQLINVFYLTTQHRRDDTDANGRKLLEIAQLWDGRGLGTPAEVEAAVDALNSRAITNIADLNRARVVVIRHTVQLFLNRRLAEREAKRLNQPIYIWRSVDTMASGSSVSIELSSALEDVSYDRTCKIPTYGIFFAGMVCSFPDSEAPALHRVTNNQATAISLIPHDLEPSLPSVPGLHILTYVPRGIIVRPDGPPLGPVASIPSGSNVIFPDDHIMIFPQSRTFTMTWKRLGMSAPIIKRWGIPLTDGYAVTDFTAQGASFGDDPWVIHLNPPPSGHLTRPAIFVMLTRFKGWDQVKLLAPLWKKGDQHGRRHVLETFKKLAEKDAALAAELQRLHAMANTQKARFKKQLAHIMKKADGWRTMLPNNAM